MMRKYFKDYVKGKDDCWTLVIDIFKDLHNIDLPMYPYCISDDDMRKYIFKTVKLQKIDSPKAGAIVHIDARPYHVGYCLNDKEFIHRGKAFNTRIDKISAYEKKIIGFYIIKA